MPLYPTMSDWLSRIALALLFVSILVMGAATSMATASNEPCLMGAPAQMDAQGPKAGDCGSTGGDMEALACAVPCMLSAPAVLPQTLPMRLRQASAPSSRAQSLLVGRQVSPDPHPPRSTATA
ncbi:hypothetical protein [Geminicoccus roseus]|uniref:hypothetical protein n=1 Tax=Geminicoccus roseus TaxID=404900 RepID=UPI000685F28D|nr:hypothetical protein [Geminicoccus roseus]